MFGDLDWPINVSRWFVSDSWVSCNPRDVVSAVYATATWPCGWVAGCLSVTRRYCIKTAKPILKLLQLSGSPIILVSCELWPLRRYPIPRGTPSAGALNTQGWEKLPIFVQFSTEIAVYHSYYRISIGSHMRSIERWHFQWPWRTPKPVFKVTAFLKSNISNRLPCVLRTKFL